MTVKNITAEDFRNLSRVTAEFHPGVNVICGDNAQGKTNLLEGIYFLSCGKSWRTRFDRDLINLDKDFAYIKGAVRSGDRDNEIDIRLGRGYKKKVLVNGVNRKVSELPEYLRAVIFSPEDLNILRAGASVRRRFLDMAISQLREKYAAALAEYEKLYDHKLRILKDCAEKPDLLSALPDFELRMLQTGSLMIHYRAHYAEKLKTAAREIHRELSGGEELTIEYKTVSTVRDPLGSVRDIFSDLSDHLESHRAAERASCSCLSGPHKDDIEIYINGKSVKSFGSQGQTRTAALTLKLAELNIVAADTGEAPVLLLDDVLSELDDRRRGFVVDRIKGSQVIITCCNEDLPGKPDKVMRMKNGVLSQE